MKSEIRCNSYVHLKSDRDARWGTGIVQGAYGEGTLLVRFRLLEGIEKILNPIATCLTPRGKYSRLYVIGEQHLTDADGNDGQKSRKVNRRG